MQTVANRRLNLTQRILNRAGRPFGINPFPVAWELSDSASSPPDRPDVFEHIFRENSWGSAESVSGPGSEIARTAEYRRALLSWLERERIESMFDAPCGDLNWMPEVLALHPMRYIGGDISEAVIAKARSRNPSLDLRGFDLCADPFPDARVWHCRDALFHLSFEDIWSALENSARSKIDYALLTTHRARLHRNVDIRTGGWRILDLERPPFNFPRARRYLKDSFPGEFPRFVGVWAMDDVRKALANRPR